MARPHRLRRADYVGFRRYFLTICTEGRRKIFVDWPSVNLVLRHFRAAGAAEKYELSAYCFMPDHVHLLVTALSETSDLRRFVKAAKQSSGFAAARLGYRCLWQEGYWDYSLRSDDLLAQKIAYLVTNPLRAGLAESIDRYPFFGSDVYSRDELKEYVQATYPDPRARRA
jgi:putative transposase